MFFAIGRMVSSFFGGIRNSRVIVFVVFIALTMLPLPLLTAEVGSISDSSNQTLWNLSIMSPLAGNDPSRIPIALVDGVLMTVLSVVLILLSENRIKAKVAKAKAYNDPTR